MIVGGGGGGGACTDSVAAEISEETTRGVYLTETLQLESRSGFVDEVAERVASKNRILTSRELVTSLAKPQHSFGSGKRT